MIHANPHAKDAETCGRWVLDWLRPRKAYMRDCPEHVIAQVARWAFHWAALSDGEVR